MEHAVTKAKLSILSNSVEEKIIASKREVVQEYKESHEFKTQELLWKRESYNKGISFKYQIFTHFGVVDTDKYLKICSDKSLAANAPEDPYAKQWYSLPPEPIEDEYEDEDEEKVSDSSNGSSSSGSSNSSSDDEENADDPPKA